MVGHLDVAAFFLTLAAVSVFTRPVRTLIHEAGHAFAAKAMGQVVRQARIGSGPIRHKLRFGGVVFEIASFSWTGGQVQFFSPDKPAGPVASRFIFAAGSLANGFTAVAAFGFAYLLQGIGVLATAFAAFSIFNLYMGFYNLIPRNTGDNESMPSDGRQLLNTFKPCRSPDPELLQLGRASSYGHIGLYSEALAVAKIDWQASPLKVVLAAMILHLLSRAEGDHAAIDFYLAHEVELLPVENSSPDDKAGFPWLWANVAWSAVKLGEPDLADRVGHMAEAAMAAAPDHPEIQGTYGAWLISIDRPEEGIPHLVGATRMIESSIDKADFCRFIARGLRRKGDEQRAAQYDALQAYLKSKP
jgi:hypothetical protein